MGFLKTLTIGSIGYVLGARAGRGRYEQIANTASKIWDSSTVRSGRSKVKNQASHSFHQAQEAASEKISETASTVKEKVKNRGDDGVQAEEEIRVQPIPNASSPA